MAISPSSIRCLFFFIRNILDGVVKLNWGDLTEFLKFVCYQELVVGKYLFVYMTRFFMEIQEKARLYQYFSKIAALERN